MTYKRIQTKILFFFFIQKILFLNFTEIGLIDEIDFCKRNNLELKPIQILNIVIPVPQGTKPMYQS